MGTAQAPRKFQFTKAVRERTPLIVGIAGQSGTGKTFSALRMATGMARILGGRIAVVDTEARRALNYADVKGPDGQPLFDFDHVDFEPPFGPLDYMAAIGEAVAKGAKIIIVDSASHEHSGEGGVMDQIDAFLDKECGDNWSKRQAMNMIAHARIKPQRKTLNNYLVQLGRKGVVLILLYRARDIVKPMTKAEKAAKKDGEDGMKHLGFQPETTSPLVYEMTQSFLLRPGADGRPAVQPDTNEEKTLTKTPAQFRGWVTGQPIDEALGEKLAKWSVGGEGAPPPKVDAELIKLRDGWVAYWAKKGISVDRILDSIGKASLDLFDRKDIRLFERYVADLKAKKITLDDAFPASSSPPPDDDIEPGEDRGDEPSPEEMSARQ